MAKRKRYYVRTWDAELQQWTPQEGVPHGPHSQWDLKRALRALQNCGYDVGRAGGHFVLVQDEENYRGEVA
jgi:hypothetical protein